MENFSEKLIQALKNKGMNKSQLCEKINMTLNGLNKSIDHNSMKIETLQIICKELDVPITYFLDVDVQIKQEGFWKRMMTDMNDEIANWRLRAYKAEELLKEHGIANFSHVSEQGGVLVAA